MYKRTFVFCVLILSLIIFTSIFHENNIKFNNTSSDNTSKSLINCNGPDTVYFTIWDSLRINNVKLFWSKNFNPWDSSVMVQIGMSRWMGVMMLTGVASYRYYVKTVDSLGRIGTMPAGAPANNYSFNCPAPDTIKPVITVNPFGNVPISVWPVRVTASVTDNYGLDSVWVRWKKSSGSISRQFRLPNQYGNIFYNTFNSIQSDVNIGDTIFYRVIAQDSSSNHNRDSSALYSFRIISNSTATIFIGTGTVPMGSTSGPYNTYWYGNKTEFLWLASEILANQGSAGYITKIGFQISEVGGQAMNGLYFRIQNTTNTTISGFTSTGWTWAFGGTYTVPGTGWQYVTLQYPYYWNGTSNLLVETCFGNTSYSTATTVLGKPATGMEYTEFHDISTCNTFQLPTAQTARANVSFVIEGLTGFNHNLNSVPTNYSLSQNYPNPFNPMTRINFDIPKQGLVSLKIYDILGREVEELVNEIKSPGSYSVDFNASDLSSGTYFYRFESNGFSDVKRMILIK